MFRTCRYRSGLRARGSMLCRKYSWMSVQLRPLPTPWHYFVWRLDSWVPWFRCKRIHAAYEPHLGVVDLLVLETEESPHGSPQELAHSHDGGDENGQGRAMNKRQRVVPWRYERVKPIESQHQVSCDGYVVYLRQKKGIKWRGFVRRASQICYVRTCKRSPDCWRLFFDHFGCISVESRRLVFLYLLAA